MRKTVQTILRIKLILIIVAILTSLPFYLPVQSPIKNVFAQEEWDCVDNYRFKGYDEEGIPTWYDEECGGSSDEPEAEPYVDPDQDYRDDDGRNQADPCFARDDDGYCLSEDDYNRISQDDENYCNWCVNDQGGYCQEGQPLGKQFCVYPETPPQCYIDQESYREVDSPYDQNQICVESLEICPGDNYNYKYEDCRDKPAEEGVEVADACVGYSGCTKASYCVSTIGEDGSPQPTCVLYDQSLGQGYISYPDAQCKNDAANKEDKFYCDGPTCFEKSGSWDEEIADCRDTFVETDPDNCPNRCVGNTMTSGQYTPPEELQQTIQAGGVNIDTSQIRQRCEEAASLNPDYYDRCLQEEAANQILTLSANDIDRGNCTQEQIDSCSSNGFACGDGKCFFKQHDVCSDVIDLPDSAEKDVFVKACKQLDAQPQDKLEQINDQLRASNPDAICKEKKADEFYCDGPACIQKSSGWDGNSCVGVFASTTSDNCPNSCKDNKDISGEVLTKIDCSFFQDEAAKKQCEEQNIGIEQYQRKIDQAIFEAGLKDCTLFQQDVSKEKCYQENKKVLDVLKRYNALDCSYTESCPEGGYKACQGSYSEDGTCRYKENGAGCSKCQEKAPDVFSKDAYCNEEGRCVNGPGAACINDKQCLKPYLAGSDEAGARCVFNEKGNDGKFKTCVGKIEKDSDSFARCKFDAEALSCSQPVEKEPDLVANSIGKGDKQNRCSEEGKCLNGPGYVCTGDDECLKQAEAQKEKLKQYAGASCPKQKEAEGKVSLCYGVISSEGVCELKEDSECSRAVDKKDYNPESDKAYCDNGVCKDGPGKICKVDSQCYFSKAPTEGQECRQTQICDLDDGSQGEQVCKGVGSGKICDLSQGGGSCSQCQPKGTVRLNKEATCDPSGACVGAPAISGCMSRADCPQPAPVRTSGGFTNVGRGEVVGSDNWIYQYVTQCQTERRQVSQAYSAYDSPGGISAPEEYYQVVVQPKEEEFQSCVQKLVPTGRKAQVAQALGTITQNDLTYQARVQDAVAANEKYFGTVTNDQAAFSDLQKAEQERILALNRLLEIQKRIGVSQGSEGDLAGKLISQTNPAFFQQELDKRNAASQASLDFTINIGNAAKARAEYDDIINLGDSELVAAEALGRYEAAVNKAQSAVTTIANLKGESGTGLSQLYQTQLDQLPTKVDEQNKYQQAVTTNTQLANVARNSQSPEVIEAAAQAMQRNASALSDPNQPDNTKLNGIPREQIANQMRVEATAAEATGWTNVYQNQLSSGQEGDAGEKARQLIAQVSAIDLEAGRKLQARVDVVPNLVSAQQATARIEQIAASGAILDGSNAEYVAEDAKAKTAITAVRETLGYADPTASQLERSFQTAPFLGLAQQAIKDRDEAEKKGAISEDTKAEIDQRFNNSVAKLKELGFQGADAMAKQYQIIPLAYEAEKIKAEKSQTLSGLRTTNLNEDEAESILGAIDAKWESTRNKLAEINPEAAKKLDTSYQDIPNLNLARVLLNDVLTLGTGREDDYQTGIKISDALRQIDGVLQKISPDNPQKATLEQVKNSYFGIVGKVKTQQQQTDDFAVNYNAGIKLGAKSSYEGTSGVEKLQQDAQNAELLLQMARVAANKMDKDNPNKADALEIVGDDSVFAGVVESKKKIAGLTTQLSTTEDPTQVLGMLNDAKSEVDAVKQRLGVLPKGNMFGDFGLSDPERNTNNFDTQVLGLFRDKLLELSPETNAQYAQGLNTIQTDASNKGVSNNFLSGVVPAIASTPQALESNRLSQEQLCEKAEISQLECSAFGAQRAAVINSIEKAKSFKCGGLVVSQDDYRACIESVDLESREIKDRYFITDTKPQGETAQANIADAIGKDINQRLASNMSDEDFIKTARGNIKPDSTLDNVVAPLWDKENNDSATAQARVNGLAETFKKYGLDIKEDFGKLDPLAQEAVLLMLKNENNDWSRGLVSNLPLFAPSITDAQRQAIVKEVCNKNYGGLCNVDPNNPIGSIRALGNPTEAPVNYKFGANEQDLTRAQEGINRYFPGLDASNLKESRQFAFAMGQPECGRNLFGDYNSTKCDQTIREVFEQNSLTYNPEQAQNYQRTASAALTASQEMLTQSDLGKLNLGVTEEYAKNQTNNLIIGTALAPLALWGAPAIGGTVFRAGLVLSGADILELPTKLALTGGRGGLALGRTALEAVTISDQVVVDAITTGIRSGDNIGEKLAVSTGSLVSETAKIPPIERDIATEAIRQQRIIEAELELAQARQTYNTTTGFSKLDAIQNVRAAEQAVEDAGVTPVGQIPNIVITPEAKERAVQAVVGSLIDNDPAVQLARSQFSEAETALESAQNNVSAISRLDTTQREIILPAAQADLARAQEQFNNAQKLLDETQLESRTKLIPTENFLVERAKDEVLQARMVLDMGVVPEKTARDNLDEAAAAYKGALAAAREEAQRKALEISVAPYVETINEFGTAERNFRKAVNTFDPAKARFEEVWGRYQVALKDSKTDPGLLAQLEREVDSTFSSYRLAESNFKSAFSELELKRPAYNIALSTINSQMAAFDPAVKNTPVVKSTALTEAEAKLAAARQAQTELGQKLDGSSALVIQRENELKAANLELERIRQAAVNGEADLQKQVDAAKTELDRLRMRYDSPIEQYELTSNARDVLIGRERSLQALRSANKEKLDNLLESVKTAEQNLADAKTALRQTENEVADGGRQLKQTAVAAEVQRRTDAEARATVVQAQIDAKRAERSQFTSSILDNNPSVKEVKAADAILQLSDDSKLKIIFTDGKEEILTVGQIKQDSRFKLAPEVKAPKPKAPELEADLDNLKTKLREIKDGKNVGVEEVFRMSNDDLVAQGYVKNTSEAEALKKLLADETDPNQLKSKLRPWTDQKRDELAFSLAERIRANPSAFDTVASREKLIADKVFTRQEVKAILDSNLVSVADVKPKFNISGFNNDEAWNKAVSETAAGLLEADRRTAVNKASLNGTRQLQTLRALVPPNPIVAAVQTASQQPQSIWDRVKQFWNNLFKSSESPTNPTITESGTTTTEPGVNSLVETKGAQADLKKEDTIYPDTQNRGVAIVADGVSSGGNGGIASQKATQLVADRLNTIKQGFPIAGTSDIPRIEQEIKQALIDANTLVQKEAGGGKTTISAGVVIETATGPRLFVANVGDSRVYVLRDSKLIQISKDVDVSFLPIEKQPAFIKALAEAKTEEELIRLAGGDTFVRGMFNRREIISEAIGDAKGLKLTEKNVFSYELKPGDKVIITSDGVHDNSTLSRMQELLNGGAGADELVEEARLTSLKGEYRSKEDDISAVVMDIKGTPKPATPAVEPLRVETPTAPVTPVAPTATVTTPVSAPKPKLEELPITERIESIKTQIEESKKAVSDTPAAIAQAEKEKEEATKIINKWRGPTGGEGGLGIFQDQLLRFNVPEYEQASQKLQKAEQTIRQQNEIAKNVEQVRLTNDLVATQKVRDASPTKDNIDKLIQEAESALTSEKRKLTGFQAGQISGETLLSGGLSLLIPRSIKNKIPGLSQVNDIINAQRAEVEKAAGFVEALKTEKKYLYEFADKPRPVTAPAPAAAVTVPNPTLTQRFKGADNGDSVGKLFATEAGRRQLVADSKFTQAEVDAIYNGGLIEGSPSYKGFADQQKFDDALNQIETQLKSPPAAPAAVPAAAPGVTPDVGAGIPQRIPALVRDALGTVGTSAVEAGRSALTSNPVRTVGSAIRYSGDLALRFAEVEFNGLRGLIRSPRNFFSGNPLPIRVDYEDPLRFLLTGERRSNQTIINQAREELRRGKRVVIDTRTGTSTLLAPIREEQTAAKLKELGFKGSNSELVIEAKRLADDLNKPIPAGIRPTVPVAPAPATAPRVETPPTNGTAPKVADVTGTRQLVNEEGKVIPGSILPSKVVNPNDFKKAAEAKGYVFSKPNDKLRGSGATVLTGSLPTLDVPGGGIVMKYLENPAQNFWMLREIEFLNQVSDTGLYPKITNLFVKDGEVVGYAMGKIPGKEVPEFIDDIPLLGGFRLDGARTTILKNVPLGNRKDFILQVLDSYRKVSVPNGDVFISNSQKVHNLMIQTIPGQPSSLRLIDPNPQISLQRFDDKSIAGIAKGKHDNPSIRYGKLDEMNRFMGLVLTDEEIAADPVLKGLKQGISDEMNKFRYGNSDIRTPEQILDDLPKSEIKPTASIAIGAPPCPTSQAPSSILDLFIKPAFAANPCPVTKFLEGAAGRAGIGELPDPVLRVGKSVDNFINKVLGREDEILSQNQRAIAMANTEGENLFYLYPNGELGTSAKNIGETPVFITTEVVEGRVVPTRMTIPDSLSTDQASQLRKSLEDFRGEPLPDTAIRVEPDAYMQGITKQTEARPPQPQTVGDRDALATIERLKNPPEEEFQLIDNGAKKIAAETQSFDYIVVSGNSNNISKSLLEKDGVPPEKIIVLDDTTNSVIYKNEVRKYIGADGQEVELIGEAKILDDILKKIPDSERTAQLQTVLEEYGIKFDSDKKPTFLIVDDHSDSGNKAASYLKRFSELPNIGEFKYAALIAENGKVIKPELAGTTRGFYSFTRQELEDLNKRTLIGQSVTSEQSRNTIRLIDEYSLYFEVQAKINEAPPGLFSPEVASYIQRSKEDILNSLNPKKEAPIQQVATPVNVNPCPISQAQSSLAQANSNVLGVNTNPNSILCSIPFVGPVLNKIDEIADSVNDFFKKGGKEIEPPEVTDSIKPPTQQLVDWRAKKEELDTLLDSYSNGPRDMPTLKRGVEGLAEVESQPAKLVESSLLVDDKFLTTGAITGDTTFESYFGDQSWVDWLNARVAAKAYGDQPLTVDFIKELHQRLTQTANPEIGAKIRTSERIGGDYVKIGNPVKYTPEQIEAINSNPLLIFEQAGKSDSNIGWIVYPSTLTNSPGRKALESLSPELRAKLGAKPTEAELVEALLEDTVNWYNAQIKNPQVDRYRLAAELQLRIISIHPFDDMNGRISRVLMDWSLENSGLPPARLLDPNDDLFSTLDEWTAKVRDGSKRYADLQQRQAGMVEFGYSDPVEALDLSPERTFYETVYKKLGKSAPVLPEPGGSLVHAEYENFLKDFKESMADFNEKVRGLRSVSSSVLGNRAETKTDIPIGGLIPQSYIDLVSFKPTNYEAYQRYLSEHFYIDLPLYRGGVLETPIRSDRDVLKFFEEPKAVGSSYQALRGYSPLSSARIPNERITQALISYNEQITNDYLAQKGITNNSGASLLKQITTHTGNTAEAGNSPFASTSLQRGVSEQYTRGSAWVQGTGYGFLYRARAPSAGMIFAFFTDLKNSLADFGLDIYANKWLSSKNSLYEVLVPGGIMPASVDSITINEGALKLFNAERRITDEGIFVIISKSSGERTSYILNPEKGIFEVDKLGIVVEQERKMQELLKDRISAATSMQDLYKILDEAQNLDGNLILGSKIYSLRELKYNFDVVRRYSRVGNDVTNSIPEELGLRSKVEKLAGIDNIMLKLESEEQFFNDYLLSSENNLPRTTQFYLTPKGQISLNSSVPGSYDILATFNFFPGENKFYLTAISFSKETPGELVKTVEDRITAEINGQKYRPKVDTGLTLPKNKVKEIKIKKGVNDILYDQLVEHPDLVNAAVVTGALGGAGSILYYIGSDIYQTYCADHDCSDTLSVIQEILSGSIEMMDQRR